MAISYAEADREWVAYDVPHHGVTYMLSVNRFSIDSHPLTADSVPEGGLWTHLHDLCTASGLCVVVFSKRYLDLWGGRVVLSTRSIPFEEMAAGKRLIFATLDGSVPELIDEGMPPGWRPEDLPVFDMRGRTPTDLGHHVMEAMGVRPRSQYKFDVGLSFAGEDRQYVEQVAEELKNRQLRVFYDKNEETELWGQNLYETLADIYSQQCRYCVVFVSQHYVEKMWTRHEFRSAQQRMLEQQPYLLPARFDDAVLDGLPATMAYVQLGNRSPAELAEMVAQKLRAGEV